MNDTVARTAPGVMTPHTLVLGEAMGWHHILGTGLILPGIYLASRQAPDRAKP
ncbi:MAG: hypothetical protein ACOYB1_04250 [Limnohabitans sp.]